MEDNKEIRPNLMHMARLAEIAERYDDMREFMKQLVVGKQGSISSLERDLLSVAYKHSVGAHRNAHRTLQAISTKKEKYDDEDKAAIDEYRKKIQKQVELVCVDLQDLLDKYLIPCAEEVDSKVFYLKMLGDYLRYMAETKDGDEDFKLIVESSRQAYQKAFDLATEHMQPTDPIRLGLVLNFSVFYFEIANAAPEATSLAKQAYKDAVAKLAELDENDYKDSTMIMELLRENLALWNMDEGRAGEEDTAAGEIANKTTKSETKKDNDDEEAMNPIQETVIKEGEKTIVGDQEEGEKTIISDKPQQEEGEKTIISDKPQQQGGKDDSVMEEEKMEIVQDAPDEDGKLDVSMEVAKGGEGA